jgi:outer membrane receptor protein involved in Fe transport
LSRGYWLPALTATWRFTPDMQLRLALSKTIARPQFRELAQQVYQDFESDREFTGNPFLTDSQLYNAEARYEWYFARDQRVSLAGFYKRLDHPIEAAAFFAGGGQLRTGFANAPRAELYGAESRPRSICRSTASAVPSSRRAGCCSSAITPTASRA